jgi:hypothetical protein
MTAAVDLAGNNVQVCVLQQPGTEDATCEAGVCENPCAADADCPAVPGFDACVDSHCGCNEDADCAGSASGEACVAANGFCGCNVDADCTGAGTDKCFEGVCGCSGNEVCTAEGTECLGIASFDDGDVDG